MFFEDQRYCRTLFGIWQLGPRGFELLGWEKSSRQFGAIFFVLHLEGDERRRLEWPPYQMQPLAPSDRIRGAHPLEDDPDAAVCANEAKAVAGI
jgi:hypothetical protein